MALKKEKTIEVLVVLTPKQILSIYKQHPDEISFTRQLITWDLAGRNAIPATRYKAKKLKADRDKLVVLPFDDTVPAFEIKAS